MTKKTWKLFEGGYQYGMVEAESEVEAIEIARSQVDASNYPDRDRTIWIDVLVRCEETEEEASEVVAIDPPAPRGCVHEWSSPEWLGGLKENPGVWGHGGGVVIYEACTKCGCGRKNDTWATNPSNGQQGVTSVSYEPRKYAEQIAKEVSS